MDELVKWRDKSETRDDTAANAEVRPGPVARGEMTVCRREERMEDKMERCNIAFSGLAPTIYEEAAALGKEHTERNCFSHARVVRARHSDRHGTDDHGC